MQWQLRRFRGSQKIVQIIFKRASMSAAVLEAQGAHTTLALIPPLAIIRVFPIVGQHTVAVAAAVEPFAVVPRSLQPRVVE